MSSPIERSLIPIHLGQDVPEVPGLIARTKEAVGALSPINAAKACSLQGRRFQVFCMGASFLASFLLSFIAMQESTEGGISTFVSLLQLALVSFVFLHNARL